MAPDEPSHLMERASLALEAMDYLACEALCLEALRLARSSADWALYARVLLPLQESRRQRRLIAAEGPILLGTAAPVSQAAIAGLRAGCVVLSAPLGPAQALALHREARAAHRHIEVLYASHAPGLGPWRLSPYTGLQTDCVRPAPEPDLTHRPLDPATDPAAHRRAASWFLAASEALGDAACAAALARVGASSPAQRVAALEEALHAVDSHELLHQALWSAAREAQMSQAQPVTAAHRAGGAR